MKRRRSIENNELDNDPLDGTFIRIEKAFLGANEILGQIAHYF